MMALDGKAIKEEIPDKDSYETSTNNVKKSKGKEQCTPDSPEGARVVAPRSPISPHHIHPLTTIMSVPNRSSSLNRHGSSSPTTTPPPTVTPTATSALLANSLSAQDNQKLVKIRRFLGALIQFGQDTNAEIGERLRSLVMSIASGTLSIEEFQIAVQDATNFPLRSNVLPFLRSHLPLLQREINSLARLNKQSLAQYVRLNESCAFDMHHNLTDAHSDIFLSSESGSGGGINLKRRATEALLYETHLTNSNLSHEWNDYISPAKRPHHSLTMLSSSALPHLINHPSMFEYQNGIHSHQEQMNNNSNNREDRHSETANRGASRLSAAGGGPISGSRIPSGDEEWRNIHTMLSCISGMAEKTKKAISILQNRGNDVAAGSQASHQEVSMISDLRRQTEERIDEIRRNAEDAVNQVKRQAVLAIQTAVTAAETRAIEMITQERIKMEKIYGDISRTCDADNNEVQTAGTNTCWNCGRKANETCGGCGIARYCGSFCQHKNWEQHHQACGSIASRTTTDSQSANNAKTSATVQHTRLSTNSSNSSSSRSSPPNQITASATANGIIPAK